MPAFDGFSPGDENAFVAYSPELAERWLGRLERLGKAFGADVVGVEHVPAGPAILVANHTFGFDVGLALAVVHRATGRRIWALGEHLWWRLPYLRRLASQVGIVDGTQANVDELLGRGELVVVLPGGMREAVKPHVLRYRLLWGHRYGFVRAAIRHQAALVPLACLGADDLFEFVGDAYARSRRWLGKRAPFPVPLPARVLPIPHRVHVRYVIGEPIAPLPRDREHDEAAVRALRREVAGALYEILDAELARREGIDPG